MTQPPDRVTVSIPPEDDLDRDVLDDLVQRSGFDNRSEFVRAAIRGDVDGDLVDDVLDG